MVTPVLTASTSNQCYTLLRILIHTVEKPYDKSVHTEEPYICDFIIVSRINKYGSQE